MSRRNLVENYDRSGVSVLARTSFGWYFQASEMRQIINERSEGKIGIWWDLRLQMIIPAAIVYMVAFEIYERIAAAYGTFGLRGQELVFGWCVLLLVFIVSLMLAAASRRLQQLGGIRQEYFQRMYERMSQSLQAHLELP